MVAVVYAVVYVKHRYSNDDSELDYRNAYGQYGLEFLIGCVIFLWIVPYGILVIVPLVLMLSTISPAGRASWKQFGKIRAYAAVCMVVVLLMGGFVPTSEPKSPEEWGEPLFTENPNAPIYPAGKQYTWLMLPDEGGLNVEIVQSLTIRSSHQFSKFSLASSTLTIADVFNMQQTRMDQAIKLLDEQIVFSIDPNEMKLIPIEDKSSHIFQTNSGNHELDIRLYDLRSLTLSSDPNGVKVGEVFCAAKGSWGGELDLLVIVRPLGHTGISQDKYAESLTGQWIDAD
ncbi:MAG: hypothetical protein P8Q94_02670 [Candidatus Poseidoniaceae archaeon]|nr:hypothetical protein [Candidatus Poseidoniaceae archaeon]